MNDNTLDKQTAATELVKSALSAAREHLTALGYGGINDAWMDTPGSYADVRVLDKFVLGLPEVGLILHLTDLRATGEVLDVKRTLGSVFIDLDNTKILSRELDGDIAVDAVSASEKFKDAVKLVIDRLHVKHSVAEFNTLKPDTAQTKPLNG